MFFDSTRTIQTLGMVSILMVSGAVRAQNIVSKGQPAAVTILDSTKEQDGLKGSVRRVRTESAKLELQGGSLVEGPRRLLEITTYSPRGDRVENVSYPSSDLVGKEEYKYDDKGNIIEMTLRDESGTILSREAYDYEIDRFGNWTKMVTKLLVFEGGTLKQEPVEVTYRTLTYYFDDQIAKIIEPSSSQRLPDLPASTQLQGSNIPALATLSGGNTPGSPIVPLLDAPPELAKPKEAEKTSAAELNKPEAVEKTSTPELNKPEDLEKASAPDPTIGSEAPSGSNVELGLLTSSPAPPANTAASENARVEDVASKNALPKEIAANTKGLEYFKAGRNKFEEGDLNGAVAAYRESIELQPDSAEVYLNLGLVYLKLEKNKDAVKAFKDSVRLQPDVAEAQYGLGLAYFRIARHKEAAEAFKRATTLRPDMAKAHYGLALAYQELGKDNALLAEFRILEILDPSLAKRLSQTFPDSNTPCGFANCK
ncbi:MAG TPA: tetratricopeptide repeat protein [Pyrinomonadaceae bacterium]|nr:tetratricopeptide repeat protein [Pyrinomonadaceae bacterium]